MSFNRSKPSTNDGSTRASSRASSRAIRGRSTTRSRANQALRAAEISAEFAEGNILPTRIRNVRRAAYAAALRHASSINSDVYSIFTAVISTSRRLHISEIPPEPKTWKELLSHQYMK